MKKSKIVEKKTIEIYIIIKIMGKLLILIRHRYRLLKS